MEGDLVRYLAIGNDNESTIHKHRTTLFGLCVNQCSCLPSLSRILHIYAGCRSLPCAAESRCVVEKKLRPDHQQFIAHQHAGPFRLRTAEVD